MKERLAASLAASDLVFCYSAGLAWDARAVLAPLGAKAVGARRLREARRGDRARRHGRATTCSS